MFYLLSDTYNVSQLVVPLMGHWLNKLHIDVYFEVEKLHINDPQAVRMLTLYASVY